MNVAVFLFVPQADGGMRCAPAGVEFDGPKAGRLYVFSLAHRDGAMRLSAQPQSDCGTLHGCAFGKANALSLIPSPY